MKWEYKVVTVPYGPRHVEMINAHGAEGWELITVIPPDPPRPGIPGPMKLQALVYFKRPRGGSNYKPVGGSLEDRL